ncbi:DUF2567 domain-containing protein [Micromonospora sp. SH-82]|uniref:DUF2567 domain-containing protein n=1 Tax=Micromonospora sp. SH-82 TaxID=3132938 RepID=UPI003EC12AB6
MSPAAFDPDRSPTDHPPADGRTPVTGPGDPPVAVPFPTVGGRPDPYPGEPPVAAAPPTVGGPRNPYLDLVRVRLDEPRLPLPRMLRLVAAVVLGLTASGVPLGLLWVLLAPATPVVRTAQGAIYASAQPEQPVAADGWFSLLALGLGILAAGVLWVLVRPLRGPVGLLSLIVGGLGSTLVAWQLGRRIGWSEYERLLADAQVGQTFERPVDLRAGGVDLVFGVLPVPYGNILLVAFGAAVAYTLLAGWSRWPSLHPEPDPYEPGPPAFGDEPGPSVYGGRPGPAVLSSESTGNPAPAGAPEPPGPDAAAPPRG